MTPFKLITVFLHEASHAIACKLTCGHVISSCYLVHFIDETGTHMHAFYSVIILRDYNLILIVRYRSLGKTYCFFIIFFEETLLPSELSNCLIAILDHNMTSPYGGLNLSLITRISL